MGNGFEKGLNIFMADQPEMFPVVQSRPPELFIVDVEPQGFNQVQGAFGRQAYSSDGSGIIRNLGFQQNDIQIMGHDFLSA